MDPPSSNAEALRDAQAEQSTRVGPVSMWPEYDTPLRNAVSAVRPYIVRDASRLRRLRGGSSPGLRRLVVRRLIIGNPRTFAVSTVVRRHGFLDDEASRGLFDSGEEETIVLKRFGYSADSVMRSSERRAHRAQLDRRRPRATQSRYARRIELRKT